ncbi:MAG: copper resistance protein [Acetobacteraceae bacterium]|nr:copper resistance protein [Acetobacteraceae bacterium]
MELFLDLYGFLSVVLKAGSLVSRSVLVGSVAFLLFLAAPLGRRFPDYEAAPLLAIARRCLVRAGWATLGFTVATAILGIVALMGTLDVGLGSALGAGFVLSSAGIVILTLLLMFLAPDEAPSPRRLIVMAALALGVLVSAVLGSHAMSRPEGRTGLLLATFLHQLGAALWLGGLPALLLAFRQEWMPVVHQTVGARYSALAGSGVALIILGILGFWLGYIVAPDALYGTAYGAMAATKSSLTGFLLLLGLGNFLLLHRFARSMDPARWLPRLRRFVECEVIAGIAVFGIAASLTSVPPSVDLPDDRASWAEVVERFTPELPRLSSPSHADLAIPALQSRLDAEWQQRQDAPRPQAFIPGEGFLPPRNAYDMAWSEYNHHMAGFIVLLVGLFALLDRTGRFPWARHWPLLFLLLAAFLFIRSDPEVWPMGEIPFLESLRDPEVLQHKLLSALVVVFAVSEWLVRLRNKRSAAAYVFPLSMALGGFLLLTHTHAISNIKEALLVELSHLPLGVLSVIAGCARWTELRGGRGFGLAATAGGPGIAVEAPAEARWAGYVWPVCLILISFLLIFYRES